MTTQNISLLKALSAKMDYLGQRQRVISQNVANSDTPGFRPQDLKPVDFSHVLKKVSEQGGVQIETTDPMHMPSPNVVADTEEARQKKVYEMAPAGNSVIMEEQLFNANKTAMDYSLMTNLYQKNINMIRLALGRN